MIAVAAILAIVAACGGSPSPTVERGVVFAEGLAADLYRPAGRPRDGTAVVLVHGGGFSEGDRSEAAGYAEALVKRGWFAAAVDYRLSEGQWFPATTLVQPGLPEAAAKARDDVLTFVAWLRDHARQYGLSPARIVLAGY